MFLDIDEFWVNETFKLNIKDYLVSLGDPDLVAFPWAFKTGEELFGNCFSSDSTFILDGHVKTIFKTSLNLKKIQAHNVVTEDADCTFSAGGMFCKKNENKTNILFDKTKLPASFVVHRLTRSETEYVSLLGRGRPSTNTSMLELKDNRGGYLPKKNHHLTWEINQDDVMNHYKSYDLFKKKCGLEYEIASAQDFIFERYSAVINTLKYSKTLTKNIVDKLFKNVSDANVVNAYESNLYIKSDVHLPKLKVDVVSEFKEMIGIDDEFINLVRIYALSLEKTSLDQAVRFMSLAHLLRPLGPVITKELMDMKAALERK